MLYKINFILYFVCSIRIVIYSNFSYIENYKWHIDVTCSSHRDSHFISTSLIYNWEWRKWYSEENYDNFVKDHQSSITNILLDNKYKKFVIISDFHNMMDWLNSTLKMVKTLGQRIGKIVWMFPQKPEYIKLGLIFGQTE